MQVGAVGSRDKKGWVAALLTTVQFKGSSARLLGAPSLPGICLPVSSLCPAWLGHKRRVDFRSWCSLQLQGASSWPPHPPISTKFLPLPLQSHDSQISVPEAPHTKQREINTQLQSAVEWGEYFF